MKLNFIKLSLLPTILLALTACDVPFVPFVEKDIPANSIMGNRDIPNSALLAFFNEDTRRTLAVRPYSDLVKIRAHVDIKDRVQPQSIIESSSSDVKNRKAMELARNMPFSPIRVASGNPPILNVYVLFYEDTRQALVYPEQEASSSPVATYFGGRQHLKFVSLD